MSELWSCIKSYMLKHSDKIVREDSEVHTYNELIMYAEERACKLFAQKYAILCKSELDNAIWILAVLAAGKTAIPLSYLYGENHYRKIVEEVKPNYIICDGKINEYSNEIDQYDKENLYDVAFIMCTSGTTGRPKGAMITKRNIMTNISDISAYFGINESDEILISRPLYHCAVLTGEFLVSLINGVNIHFVNKGFNPTQIINYISTNKITVFCNTPSSFYYICRLTKDSTLLSSLKKVAVSGECMTTKSSELMTRKIVNAEIYNVYGLTEASPRVSYLNPDLFNYKPLSVGQPLRSVEIKVVNNEGDEVEFGETGELLVKGNNVMKGYYRDKEKTDEIIKSDWLYTGDLATIEKDGLLYIKSRKDDMIIKAGMNIYPQEIENAMMIDKRIKDALVYGIQSGTSQRVVVDVIPNEHITKSDIIKICEKNLSAYQIPDEIHFVDYLCKNASGKKVRRYQDD